MGRAHPIGIRGLLLVVLGLAFVPPASAERARLDTTTLARQLRARGFVAPPQFKALVLRISRGDDGTLITERLDYRGTSDDRGDWWPASSVKLFAAIAALERLHELGFTPDALLTFNYSTGAVTLSVAELVTLAIVPSDNVAFDRLVEVVGFDEINSRFFVRRNGLSQTVLLRGYGGRVRYPDTDRGSLAHSPEIVIRQGERVSRLPERNGQGTYDCPEQGNCTTLHDLAEAMRRVMLHEELPARERFRLGPTELSLLREALEAPRPTNQRVVDGMREAFGLAPIRYFHKTGTALGWFTDNVFVERGDTGQRWIVTMCARGTGRALDEASRHMGALLASSAI